MITTELLQELRDTLDDPLKNKWPDELLLRAADTHIRSMFREQSVVNDSWHNCDVNIAKERFTEFASTMWECQLRSWVDKVLIVWKRERNPTFPDHESPEMVLRNSSGASIEQHVARINPTDVYRSAPGFQLAGKTTLRLVRFLDIVDVTLQVTKLPARLTRGTIDRESGDDSFFYLQSEATSVASNGLHSAEWGAYRNSGFQFGSIGDTGGEDVLSGSVRGCIHSEMEVFTSSPAGKNIRVYLDAPLPRALRIGDTYESMPEVSDANMRYLILCVARQCFTKQKSVSGLAAIAQELQEEHQRWRNNITPRQLQEPSFIREATDARPNEFQRQDFDSGLSNRGW